MTNCPRADNMKRSASSLESFRAAGIGQRALAIALILGDRLGIGRRSLQAQERTKVSRRFACTRYAAHRTAAQPSGSPNVASDKRGVFQLSAPAKRSCELRSFASHLLGSKRKYRGFSVGAMRPCLRARMTTLRPAGGARKEAARRRAAAAGSRNRAEPSGGLTPPSAGPTQPGTESNATLPRP